jgi:hypothetical protein
MRGMARYRRGWVALSGLDYIGARGPRGVAPSWPSIAPSGARYRMPAWVSNYGAQDNPAPPQCPGKICCALALTRRVFIPKN